MEIVESSFKKVENAVGKGEQFLLFLQGFRKTCAADTFKQRFLGKKLKFLNEKHLHFTERTKIPSTNDTTVETVLETCRLVSVPKIEYFH